MHLATKAKQENETEEAVQYDVNSTSSIKYDVSKSYVQTLWNHLRNDLRLIFNCTFMPLSNVEHDKQLMIVGFFFMRKCKHT